MFLKGTKMKKLMPLVLLSLFLFLQAKSETKQITIMHLNDTHSNLLPGMPRDNELNGKVGGLARAITIIKNEKSLDSNAMLLLTGNYSVGDFFFNKYLGALELSILSLQKIDAVGIQSHEFDLGPEIFQQIAYNANQQYGINFVSSNIVIPSDGFYDHLRNLIKNKYIKDYNGVKIGIIQLGLANNLITKPDPISFNEDFTSILNNLTTELKNENVQIIVLMSGLDEETNSSIAKNIPSINVIIASNHYYPYSEPIVVKNNSGKDSYIVSAGPDYRNIGKISIDFDEEIKSFSWNNISLDSTIKEDLVTKVILDVYSEDIDTSYSKPVPPITYKLGNVTSFYKEHLTPQEMTSPGYKDCPVGILISKSYTNWAENKLDMKDIDFSITLNGATSQPLYEGTINGLDVFRMLGYGFTAENMLGNRLIKARISGSKVLAGLNYCLNYINDDDEFFIQSDKLKYTYNSDFENFQKLVEVTLNGESIDNSRTYTFITNEFIGFVLNYFGLADSFEVIENSSEYSTVVEYILQNPVLNASIDNNILNVAQGSCISEVCNQNQVKVYPNPAQDFISFNFENPVLNNLTIEIYDIKGNFVQSKEYPENIQNNSSVYIDIKGLQTGVYNFVVKYGKSIKLGRFVKSN